jgi:hypothetical protein
MDAEVFERVGPMLASAEGTLPQAGDWQSRRTNAEYDLDAVVRALPPVSGITVEEYPVTVDNGTTVRLYFYRSNSIGNTAYIPIGITAYIPTEGGRRSTRVIGHEPHGPGLGAKLER